MQRPLPSAVFDGEQRRPLAPDAFSQCPPGQFAVGVYGRTVYNDDPDRRGVYLGALGLMCDAPRVESPGTYVARVGRDRNGSAGPEKSICDKARDAAARNSPAATQLALLCKVSPKMPLSGARIATSGVGVRAPSAGGARADAPPDLDALAARGAELAAEDPLATTLRDAQGEGDLRRAFDIGAGISEGQTAWGPGKQRVRDALPPAERDAYSIATSYFLDRNRHADRIAIGMEIAAADPEVAARRAAEADARFTLGFDVAAAIFGDPALGAQGNEVMGPGARSIRDALSAEVTKRGFDAAYEFLHARR
jgi:hypothetical protein